MPESIIKILGKVVNRKEDLMLGLGVGLLVLLSFGLGRLSAIPYVPESIQVAQSHGEAPAGEEMAFVASKNGIKYHLLACPGAKQIKEENKIYFSSKEEAEGAGYGPAANCPELSVR